jgi:glycine oxidase
VPLVRACLPWVHQVRNPRLCRALAQTLKSLGVELADHEAALSIELSHGRAVGVRTARRSLRAEHVCICAGAWSSPLLDATGWAPKIAPVKGQMLLLRLAQAVADDAILIDQGFYLVPREPDLVVVGSTLEHAGFDKATSSSARDLLLAAAQRLLPHTGFTLEHHWAGLRPGNIDGVPTISSHPSVEGLWLNSGHYRNGLTLAPGSAQRLANLIGKPAGRATSKDAKHQTAV